MSVSVEGRTATVVRQPVDAAWLAKLSPARLLTRFGVLDLMWSDETAGGFPQWNSDAVDVRLGDVSLRVASLEHLIASKERADRVRDRASLPFLRALLSRD